MAPSLAKLNQWFESFIPLTRKASAGSAMITRTMTGIDQPRARGPVSRQRSWLRRGTEAIGRAACGKG